MGDAKEYTFGASERKSLQISPAYECLVGCLSQRLKQLRDTYDTVKPNDLLALQGRVFELQALLGMIEGGQDNEHDDAE